MSNPPVALITGSTSGIGLAVAHGFAKAGYAVMLNGLGSPAQIDDAKSQVAAHGGDVDYHPADPSRSKP